MKIAVFGLGYVGTVSAACLAQNGHEVIGVDISPEKLELINQGTSPIVEPEVDRILSEGVEAGRLRATADPYEAVTHADVSLICVGTPSRENGSLDLSYVRNVAADIGRALQRKEGYHLVAVRSTMLPGSLESEVMPILYEESGKRLGGELGLCINPEFLREGTAVADYHQPPFTLIGAYDDRSGQTMSSLYENLDAPVIQTDIRTAEMVKYACNAYHALKVTFANEMGVFCKKMGVDSHKMMDIFVQDTSLNISSRYLRPGFAFGGSCLPKDLRALLQAAKMQDVELPLLASLLPSNDLHIDHCFRIIEESGNRNIGVLGLAFKAGTDDLRESPMVRLVERLVGKGYQVRIYDKEVSLSKLVGSNKRYIEEQLPHISKLMVANVNEIMENSDSLVIGDNTPQLRSFLERINGDHQVIDLVRVDRLRSHCNGNYQGICW